MSPFTRRWGRRTGTAAAALALALAAAPAAARPIPKDRASASAPDVPARLTLGPGGLDLRLAGDLTEGVAAQVAGLLAAHPQIARLHLTSDGGLVEEGAAIGALVAARGLSTYVPDVCASACTLIFVRGRARYLATGGRLGFHAPYARDARGRPHRVDAAPERAAYRDAGLPQAFVARALAVPPADIWIPAPEALRAAGIVTELVGTDRFPDSTLDADPSPQGARTTLLRVLPVLRLADTAALDPIARWYRDGYAAGRPEAEAARGLKRLAAAYLRRRFQAADDRIVMALGRQALATMQAAEAHREAACAAIAAGDLVMLDTRLRADSRSGTGLAPLLARTPPRMPGRMPPDTPGAASAQPDPIPPTACGLRIARTRQALALPVSAAAAALRALFLTEPQQAVATGAGS